MTVSKIPFCIIRGIHVWLGDKSESLNPQFGNLNCLMLAILLSVAAEDVGLHVVDLNNVHQRTRYTTCIGEDLGGSGNPSIATGKGKHLFKCDPSYANSINQSMFNLYGAFPW